MKDIYRITLADMILDIFSGYVQVWISLADMFKDILGYNRIYQDMLGYLNWISFLGYDFQSYPNSQKISLNILTYPYISYHILSCPKISSGANSQMYIHGILHVYAVLTDMSGIYLVKTSWVCSVPFFIMIYL